MRKKITDILPIEKCLPGRSEAMQVSGVHAVSGASFLPPFAHDCETVVLALGCFWGAERLFWRLPGVAVTAVGYAGGVTENPTYQEVCSGYTNHTEVVLVAYKPSEVSLQQLLQTFWEEHDPTQGMRQGNDRGTQYRSAIYVNNDAGLAVAEHMRSQYSVALKEAGIHADITTEIARLKTFYYAEEAHQQYLHKVPNGYCGLAGSGVRYSP